MTWTTVAILGLSLLYKITIGASHTKVYGGEDVKIQFFPHQVSLRTWNVHFCGGAIISDRHILTAAHCLDDYDEIKDFFRVHSGTHQTNKPGNAHKVLSVHVHPNWTEDERQGYSNDIAVITLKEPMVFNKHQNKINLPAHEPRNFQKAYLTGWGKTSKSSKDSPIILQKLTVELMTSDTCKDLVTHKISEKQICSFLSIGTGACRGDSGGPLVSKGVLVGIVSFMDGNECAAGTPDIYTNVFAYKDFIESVMND